MKIKLITLLSFLLFTFSACGGSSGDDSSTVGLRVVHNSPDAPSVDVFLNDLEVLSDVSYLDASPYLEVPTGINMIRVNAAGTETTVIEASLDLNNDTSVIASGLLSDISPLVLNDTRETAGSESVLVRAIHGAPSAPVVDIFVLGEGESLEEAEPTLVGVPFGGASDYLELVAGDYNIIVTPTGTKDIAIESGLTTLEGGRNLSVIAIDATGGGAPFSFNILEDQA